MSPEAPIPKVEVVRKEYYPGGAGNVVMNLRELGCPVLFVYIESPLDTRILMPGAELTSCYYASPEVRTRYIDQVTGHQILRVDEHYKNIETLDPSIVFEHCNEWIKKQEGPIGVILSDYRTACSMKEHLDLIDKLQKHECFLDTRREAEEVCDLLGEERIDFLIPNRKEFTSWCKMTEDETWVNTVLKQSEEGITYLKKNTFRDLRESWSDKGVHFPATTQEIVDVTGAGDTVTACFAAHYMKYKDPIRATEFANVAAGYVVKKKGTVPVTLEGLGIKKL